MEELTEELMECLPMERLSLPLATAVSAMVPRTKNSDE